MSNYNITILEEIATLSVSPRGEEKTGLFVKGKLFFGK